VSYLPIEEHGFIGDMHSAALIGVDGTIDWMCLPRFDSPSVFAAILDDRKGGYFRISPVDRGVKLRQLYHPDTNVLITRFLSEDGVGEIVDFMPVETDAAARRRHRLIRKVSAVRGAMKFRVECFPAFNYARTPHTLRLHRGRGASFHTDDLSLDLVTDLPLRRVRDGVAAEFTLEGGRAQSFSLQRPDPGERIGEPLADQEYEELHRRTVSYWRSWLSHCTYHGRWREQVYRSALALKLMTYDPTGALVAAPTTSLPESIGHGRNWDYRYTWIRDSAFTMFALLRIGFTSEAERFMGFVEARCRELENAGSLQVLYGIGGEHELKEIELDHLKGYRGSRPVRIGNDAHRQLQLDIYGELLDAVYLCNKDATPISYDFWENLRRLLDWLQKHWQEPDDGIWEVRGGEYQFTYSRMMSWVAFDRALRLGLGRGLPMDFDAWRRTRDDIFDAVMTKGWDPKQQSFVQYFGGKALDASMLLAPVVRFVSTTDPRAVGTLEAVLSNLVSDSLVYRYDPQHAARDGLHGHEGTFSLCTFWLVEALTRAGRLEEARLIFEKMFTYANHLGLFSEEIGPSGEGLGNFPQAFTHLSLITAAYNLNQALDRPGHRGELQGMQTEGV